MSHQDEAPEPTEGWSLAETAAHMAEQVCQGFQYHDRNDSEAAIEAFATVDELQFHHIDEESASYAAEAYVDALWKKDQLEVRHLVDGDINRDALYEADWESVEAEFRKRTSIVGMDPRYAEYSTRGWRNHKTGRDYWTPIMQAQVYELRAALQDPTYPHKPRYGQAGHGPEAARYVLAVELHDMHTELHWEQTKQVMTPYYQRILTAHRNL